MKFAEKLKTFLNERKIKYVTISHSPAFTAPEVAASAHIPGRILAKTVIVVINDTMAMAVAPANLQVDLDVLRKLTGSTAVRLAREEEFQDLFSDCLPGGMPPFGNLYGLDVYVSPELAKERDIAFNAGSHVRIIKMAYRDFEQLVKPRVASFTA